MRRYVLAMIAAASFAAACGEQQDPPPPPPELTLDHPHVVSSWTVPTSEEEADAVASNVDGDSAPENRFGDALVSTGLGGILSELTRLRTDEGTFILLVNVKTEDPPGAVFQVALLRGENPDPEPCIDAEDTGCRQHLSGTAQFTVASGAEDAVLDGELVSGRVAAEADAIELPMLIGDTLVDLPLEKARVSFGLAEGALSNGKLGGAIREETMTSTIVPELGEVARAIVAADCTMPTSPPSCGCISGAAGATLLARFDLPPKDCAVTDDEIAADAAWDPDVDLDGNGTPDAISFGFGFSAVKATFAVP